MNRTVHFVSLGCPKNLVDSEVMLGLLSGDGYAVVERPEDAALIVVNTCSFIDPAKEESVNAILEAATYKHPDKGQCQKLVVAGCLSQRYPKELAAGMPEVDHFLGTGEYQNITDIIRSTDRIAVGIPRYVADHESPRALSTENPRQVTPPDRAWESARHVTPPDRASIPARYAPGAGTTLANGRRSL